MAAEAGENARCPSKLTEALAAIESPAAVVRSPTVPGEET